MLNDGAILFSQPYITNNKIQNAIVRINDYILGSTEMLLKYNKQKRNEKNI
jgi:hypothetical protein